MQTRLLLFSLLAVMATEAHAANPADPGATVPPGRYESITAGTRSYRPVEPMPWGEVNRRVAPPGALSPATQGRPPPAQPQPKSLPEKDKQ